MEFSELKLDESEVISRKSEVIHGKSFSSKKSSDPIKPWQRTWSGITDNLTVSGLPTSD